MKNKEVVYDEHESYGLLFISRGTSSGYVPLFGSSIKHNHVITLTISRAKIGRELCQDNIFEQSGFPIVEVELSASQFADAITSLNVGAGTPCTIDRVAGKKMANCPHISKQQQFSNEVHEHMDEASNIVDAALNKGKSMLEEDRVSKTTLKELVKELEHLKMQIKSNLPFIQDQLTRQMEKSVTEAKAEVEAFVTGVIQKTGLQALKEQAPVMIEGTKENE